MIKKLYFLCFLIVFGSNTLKAQLNLSVFSEVSIITAGPGEELYEAFGHSAIRIKDPVLQLDLVYNYGMFDFSAPNFYSNFTKGKLLYKLGRYEFKYFLASYQNQNRWIKAQVLDLTQAEKQSFFAYLEQNVKPANARYLYDPFYDNCASKLRDISKNILGDRLVFNAEKIEQNLSLRTLMNRRVDWNTWGGFGINLALGSILDRQSEVLGYMYLPDYVYEVFKHAELDGKPFIKKETDLFVHPQLKYESGFLSPFFIFVLLASFGIWITYKDYLKNKRTKSLDFIIFFGTGIIGVLLTYLWFFTDHSTTPKNFNILWAFAPNIIIGFLLNKAQNKQWISKYILLLIFFIGSIPILWIIKIQVFPLAILPLLLLISFRYLYLYKYFK